MQAQRKNLERLFAPESIAVVGASASPDKAGHQALLALASFRGEVFPINPSAEQVLGRRAFPSLRALGRPVDLVLFAIPAAACVEAVREAVACGCASGLVLSGGFAEAGSRGVALQAELRAACASSAFRLLGPNTAGFVNKRAGLTATFVPGAASMREGPVAVVAQSAGVNLSLGFLLERSGSGVSLAVGLGNAMDVDATAVLEYLAEDPAAKAIALHLEGIEHGRALYDTLRRVTARKPVAVLTVGRANVGAFALSHTGRLIGSYALRVTALRQAGAVVVDSLEELALAAAVLARHRLAPKRAPGIGLMTAQAGPGLLMLDRLRASGVSVPRLRDTTLEQIRQRLPPMTFFENPVDTGRPGPSFGEVLRLLAEDAEIDAVIAYALHEPAALRAEVVLPEVVQRCDKPVLFGTVGPAVETAKSVETLRNHGVYAAESPDALARAAVVLAVDASSQARLREEEPVLSASNVAALPRERDEHAAKQLLEQLGIPTPRRAACASHDEAVAAFQRFQQPVVLKILAAEVLHKTEAGGVQLNIRSEAELSAALARLDAIPLRSERRYLVEEQAPPGLELIVGAVRDAAFGPTLMLGAGGTLVEAVQDTVTRLAPLGLAEADAMLEELRLAPLFQGFRGGPALARDAVARVLCTLGALLSAAPKLQEIEINPLRVYPEGVLALDALLR